MNVIGKSSSGAKTGENKSSITSKKASSSQSINKRPQKNPIDPNLLARSVIESFIGEPLIEKPKEKSQKASSSIRKKKR